LLSTITLDERGIIIAALALVIGIPAFVFALPQIFGSVSALWAGKKLAIFGPQAVGKTTLLHYLRGEAVPRFHIPTIGASVPGRIALDLKGDRTVYFVAMVVDVGGEFRQQSPLFGTIIRMGSFIFWIPVIRRLNEPALSTSLKRIKRCPRTCSTAIFDSGRSRYSSIRLICGAAGI
jgi:GTPase SAR1 family protein